MARGGYQNMSGDGALYDDVAFELFVVAFIAAVWVPIALFKVARTALSLRREPISPFIAAREQWCPCSQCQSRARAVGCSKRPRLGVHAGDVLFALAGVVLALGIARVYITNRNAEPPFDPFAILGVSETATKQQVSKAYRNLALKYHPDKNRGDPTAAEKFIRISKAFAALTDEVAHENYRKYGNPDGYIGTTLGVGLPSWMEHNTSVMLAAYVLGLLSFPVIVGLWWYKQSDVLPTSVLATTYRLYCETVSQTHRFYDLLACVAGSFEFAPLFNPELMDVVKEVAANLKRTQNDNARRAICVQGQPHQIQNFIILNAYLCRMEIPSKLQYIVDAMLARMEIFLTALTDSVGCLQREDCQSAWERHPMRGHSTLLANCVNMTQCIIQAVDKNESPLLQIPGFTKREVRYCNSSRANPSKNVYEFMRLESSVQRDILRGFSDQQFLDVQAFCNQYPQAMLELGEPFVEGEEDATVHANDAVTINGKLTVMRRAGSVYSAHTPNLPLKKAEVWWVWLNDQKRMCPIEVKRLLPKDARGHDSEGKQNRRSSDCCGSHKATRLDDRPSGDSCEDMSNELARDPRVTVYDLQFEFLAPRAGTYMLDLVAAVDCYVGCDRSKTIKMTVAEAVEEDKIPEVKYFDTDDESSDDESDASSSASENDIDKVGTDPEDDSYEYIEVSASDSDDLEDPNEIESSTDIGDDEDDNDDDGDDIVESERNSNPRGKRVKGENGYGRFNGANTRAPRRSLK